MLTNRCRSSRYSYEAQQGVYLHGVNPKGAGYDGVFQHVCEAGGQRDFPKIIGIARDGLVRFRFAEIEPYLSEIGADELRWLRRATDDIDQDGFQIWGIPAGAKSVLRELRVDDFLLLLEAVAREEVSESLRNPSIECFALSRQLLMLWTAPPPAHECHGCGRC